jgi:hypothetical protein
MQIGDSANLHHVEDEENGGQRDKETENGRPAQPINEIIVFERQNQPQQGKDHRRADDVRKCPGNADCADRHFWGVVPGAIHQIIFSGVSNVKGWCWRRKL